MILALCDRFHCLPSQLEAEGTGLLRMIAVEREVQEVMAGG